jgi:NAD(P)-dependent dehydrogenase (short-subunit alcohol dehydrogenase family)
MGKLDGKVAIITGSASGIGRATAKLFAQEGAKVVVADRDTENGVQVAADVHQAGREATFLHADVRVPEQVEAMIQKTVTTYGKLDILYNNAGIPGDQAATGECSVDNWDNVLATNLRGVFLGMRYAIPEMITNGGGVIINTASVNGMTGMPYHPAYTASKGGVIQLTRTAALEYARHNIRVNCICPGGIWTNIIKTFWGDQFDEEMVKREVRKYQPIGRFGQPEEIARLALFLASDDSSFCTGAPFIADGGTLAGAIHG